MSGLEAANTVLGRRLMSGITGSYVRSRGVTNRDPAASADDPASLEDPAPSRIPPPSTRLPSPRRLSGSPGWRTTG